MDIRQDLHIHTTRSNCAKRENDIPAIAARLDERGIILAGLTDHIDAPEHADLYARVVEANRADVEAAVSQCRILVGVEATMITPEQCAFPASLVPRVDFVMASANHYHLGGVQRPRAMEPDLLANHHIDMMLGAAQLGYITTIAHPFLIDYCERALALETMKHYRKERLRELLKAAGKAGMAFEINPYRIRSHIEWFRDLIQEARRYGTRFTLGSDSHSLQPIGFPEEKGPLAPHAMCDQLGLMADDILWPFTNRIAIV